MQAVNELKRTIDNHFLFALRRFVRITLFGSIAAIV
jgi:hypothetical protein